MHPNFKLICQYCCLWLLVGVLGVATTSLRASTDDLASAVTDCADISIATSGGTISVSGLGNAPFAGVHIFDAGWNTVFQCFGNDCGNTATVSLPAGQYHVYAKYFNSGYQEVCVKNETVTVPGDNGGGDNGGGDGNGSNDDPLPQAGTDCCEVGEKPVLLTFTYQGGACPGNNTQDDKSECTGGAVNAGTVNITVTEKEDGSGDQYFSGTVAQGESFTFGPGPGEDKFPSAIFINVNGQQLNEFHTSCSAPIVVGETFGAVRFDGLVDKDGFTCGNPDAPNNGGGNGGGQPTGTDCCEVGEKPVTLTFSYQGGACPGNNTQDDKSECSGGAVNAGVVNIMVTEKEDGSGDMYFNGSVALGENFTFSAEPFDDKFPSAIFIKVNGQQVNEMHTSCSAPIVIGESFGAVRLEGLVDKDGFTCGNPDAPGNGGGNPPGQDCCDTGDKPVQLTWRYVGGACPGNNTQDDKSECGGNSVDAGSVLIKANEKEDGSGDQYFSGTVSLGQEFTFGPAPGEDKFPSKIFINLGGQQINEFHTSCSAPIIPGQTFGALQLVSVVFQDGFVCSEPDPCANAGGDSDDDGVCDDDDCQPNNPNFPATPGTACNDGNPNTTNDVVDADGCGCTGTPIDPCANAGGDSDNDGVCDADDCLPFNPNFPATPGTACNDFDPNTTNDVVDADGCGCTGTPVNDCANAGGDSDNDGVCDNQDCQPNNPNFPATPGTACNDGNPNTINDVVGADGCSCAGTPNTGEPDCANIGISVQNGKIVVTGLDGAPISSVQIFNQAWQTQFQCFADCGAMYMQAFPVGTYYVYVKYFGANYQQICAVNETVVITPGGNVCTADAGTVTPDQASPIFLQNGLATISASTATAPTVPAGSQLVYVLTRGDDLVIKMLSSTPSFTVNTPATYRIHPLVYDPNTLDLSQVQTGVTTGVDVINLIAAGDLCADLDATGAVFVVTTPTGGGTCPFDIDVQVSNVACDDNGTPDDTSDDTFTFTVLATNGNPWGYSGGGLSGDFGVPLQAGPFPISGGDLTITIVDNDNPSCTETFTVAAPSTCSEGNGGNGGGGGTGTGDCASIGISSGANGITVTGLNGSPVSSVQVFNSSWQTEFSCFADCGGATVTVPVGAGDYYVYVKLYTAQYSLLCEVNETVTVGGANLSVDPNFLQLGATLRAERVDLSWSSNLGGQAERYFLDHSVDGATWTPIAERLSARADAQIHRYQAADTYPAVGVNYYRVRAIGPDGTVETAYSERIFFEELLDFAAFPNPAHTELRVNLSSVEGLPVVIDCYDAFGTRVDLIEVESATRVPHRIPTAQWREGSYYLHIRAEGKRAVGTKVMILHQ